MTTTAVRTASQLRTIARDIFSKLIGLDHSLDLTRNWGGSDTTDSLIASTPIWRGICLLKDWRLQAGRLVSF